MTAKQKAARQRFKAIQAEAKKLRKKNPKLTQAEAVKQAWAISYTKKRGKKIGDYNLNKSEFVETRPPVSPRKKTAKKKKKFAVKREFDGTFKKIRRISGTHKDTKSHNVNIRVVSGILYGVVTGSKYSKLAQQLIIDNIETEGYNVKAKTDLDKIKFLKETFFSEYGWAVPRMGLQNSIESWLRGLPSVLTLPFYNNEILEIAQNWGSLPKNATEKQEDKILNNYWKLMAANVAKLFKKVK